MAGERRAYSTTQLFGLALMATAMIVVMILTFLLIDTEDSYWPVATVATVATVVAVVAWRFEGLWAKTLGLLGTLAVGGSVSFLAFGLLQPFSPFESMSARSHPAPTSSTVPCTQTRQPGRA